MIRYADDVVFGFEREEDAKRFLDAMRTRLGAFELSLHPDKTRLIEFGRYAAPNRKERGLGKPETFNFLGFTFICGKSRRGSFLINRTTRADRKQTKLREIGEELRHRWHQSIPEQGTWLRRVMEGHFAYFGVPTNARAILTFRHHVKKLWLNALRRRSQRDRSTWGRIAKLADEWLPKAAIRHPWPNVRFDVKYLR